MDASEKYIIGDPRNQNSYKVSYLTKYGNGSLKGLQQYLKTKGEVTNEREVDNIIAPAFRIASSFGVTQDISYSIAQKRCASYQENGYPCWAWRVPTEAEIEFIVSLSNKKYIPELFDGEYFASSQRYYMGNLAQQVVGEEIRVLAGMALMLFVVFMMYGIGVMIRLLTKCIYLGRYRSYTSGKLN